MHKGAKWFLFAMMEAMQVDELTHRLVTLFVIWHVRYKASNQDPLYSPMSTHLFMDNFSSDFCVAKGPSEARH